LWPTILSNLGLMGCNWVLAREVAVDRARENDWTISGFCLGLAMATVFFLVGYALTPLLLPSDRSYLLADARLCLWLIPLDISNQILLAVEHGRMRWGRFNLLRLSFFLFYLTFILLIGLTRRVQVRWFIWGFLASHLLAVLVRLWLQRRALSSGKVQPDRCRRLVRAGVPYWGATISNLIAVQLDTILVVGLLSTQAAGIYAVAGTFAGGQSSLTDALGLTTFAVSSNEPDSTSRGRIIAETFRQSALLFSGIGFLLIGLIPFLVKPLFGAAYYPAIWPAVILAAAASWTGSANILNQGLRGAGRPHAGLVSQLIGAAVMAITVLLFLRRFGLPGVACAVLLSACVQSLVLIFAASNWLQISPFGFWPFRVRNVRLFWQQLAAVRLRFSRSLA
jgi:O-antigen/teichoic acid export membrane protein